MQLRHIRPGSLEWQESKTEEVEKGFERLTPEEIEHLRSMSKKTSGMADQEGRPSVEVQ